MTPPSQVAFCGDFICAEVAITAQPAATDPSIDVVAVMGRLGDLLAHFDFHARALGDW